jgi:hypothetical protein
MVVTARRSRFSCGCLYLCIVKEREIKANLQIY